MFLHAFRQKLKRKLRTECNYYSAVKNANRIKPGNQVVFADVSGIALNRYLYNFLKFFQISGYTVYLPKEKRIIDVLSKKTGEFEYASWLLQDNFIKFGKPSRTNLMVWMDSHQLSNDYFSSLLSDASSMNYYHVPMSEYPFFYHVNMWGQKENVNKNRKKSLFMIGNCDRKYYQQISKSPFFKLPSRYDTVQYLSEKEYIMRPPNIEVLEEFLEGDQDSKTVLVDTSKQFQLGGAQMKIILSKFQFYLALPGVVIPQSHNLIEAMAAGCIPVLHRSYADMMRPKLISGHNCMTYEDLEDLDEVIKSLYKFSQAYAEEIQCEVLKYYKQFLHPKSVVDKIANSNFDKIYIQAENLSLSYLNNITIDS